MKLKQEFVLREIAGDSVLIPIASLNDPFRGIISLNDTGAFIWKQIENNMEEIEIVQKIVDIYNVSEEDAVKDVKDFCNDLRRLGII